MDRLTNKQKILFFSLVLIVLILLSVALNSYLHADKFKTIDYKNEKINDIIKQSAEVNDTNIYWTLNDIIVKYLSNYNFDDFYSNYDSYNTLTKKYKKFLDKKEYAEKYKDFVGKFVLSGHLTPTKNDIQTYDLINKIYKFDENAYICQLISENESIGYIGLKLNTNSKTAEIFYIE